MMCHYDNLGVKHALENFYLLYSGKMVELGNCLITWDKDYDIISRDWIGDEPMPDRCTLEVDQKEQGTWAYPVIFGSKKDLSYENLDSLIVFGTTEQEEQLLMAFSYLLRGFSALGYRWEHRDTHLQLNNRKIAISFGEFCEILSKIHKEIA